MPKLFSPICIIYIKPIIHRSRIPKLYQLVLDLTITCLSRTFPCPLGDDAVGYIPHQNVDMLEGPHTLQRCPILEPEDVILGVWEAVLFLGQTTHKSSLDEVLDQRT